MKIKLKELKKLIKESLGRKTLSDDQVAGWWNSFPRDERLDALTSAGGYENIVPSQKGRSMVMLDFDALDFDEKMIVRDLCYRLT